MRRYWISDTHFGHKLVAEKRGFSCVEEHDEFLVESINSLVRRREDMVWHTGDVGVGPEEHTLRCVDRLNGRWLLVTGNHDAPWPGHKRGHIAQRRWMEHFQYVQPFARTQIGDFEVLMSHFPYAPDPRHGADPRLRQYSLRDEGKFLLHGHTHQDDKIHGPRQVNLSLEAWRLKPATEAELLELLRSMERQ